jgi:uracil-DNA glycosylase family 4
MSLLYVYGRGPVPAEVMLIGERAGEEESRRGYPFCGKSGRELDRYLLEGGVHRDEVYCTNLCKDFIKGNPDPEPWEIERDEHFLIDELRTVRPRYIGLVGRFAARYFLGEDFDLEALHGLPFQYSRCSSCGQIYPESLRPSGNSSERLLDLVGSDSTRRRGPETIHLREGLRAKDTPVPLRRVHRQGSTRETTPSQMQEHTLREPRAFRAVDTSTTSCSPSPESLSKWSSNDPREYGTRTSLSHMPKGNNEKVEPREQSSQVRIQQAMGSGAQGTCSCAKPRMEEKEEKVIIMPLFHVAFGLHSPNMTPLVWSDFQAFCRMVKGELDLTPRVDEYQEPEYTLIRDDEFPLFESDLPIYIDTEGSVEHPWGLSFTQWPGKAWVVLASNKFALKVLAKLIREYKLLVVLHNALHDLSVLHAMGIKGFKFLDTMVRSYHCCLLPQGLKPLSRRLCGMVQDDYEDVIGEADKEKKIQWLVEAWSWVNNRWPEESKTLSSPKTRKVSGRRSKGISLVSAGRSNRNSVPSRSLLSTTSR